MIFTYKFWMVRSLSLSLSLSLVSGSIQLNCFLKCVCAGYLSLSQASSLIYHYHTTSTGKTKKTVSLGSVGCTFFLFVALVNNNNSVSPKRRKLEGFNNIGSLVMCLGYKTDTTYHWWWWFSKNFEWEKKKFFFRKYVKSN